MCISLFYGTEFFKPGVPISLFQVVDVVLVAVSFPFKSDVFISQIMLFISDEVDEIKQKIEDIKRYYHQLKLLS